MRKKRISERFKPAKDVVQDMWDNKDIILGVYPELRADWVAAEAIISKKKCKSCQKRAQKRTILNKIKALDQTDRDLDKVASVLGISFVKSLKNEPDPPPAVPVNSEKKEIKEGSVREPCADCCRKHIAQAIILINESLMGYPEHRWLAVGHLAEASEEIIGEYPALAIELRTERLLVMDGPDYIPNLMRFFGLLDDLENS